MAIRKLPPGEHSLSIGASPTIKHGVLLVKNRQSRWKQKGTQLLLDSPSAIHWVGTGTSHGDARTLRKNINSCLLDTEPTVDKENHIYKTKRQFYVAPGAMQDSAVGRSETAYSTNRTISKDAVDRSSNDIQITTLDGVASNQQALTHRRPKARTSNAAIKTKRGQLHRNGQKMMCRIPCLILPILADLRHRNLFEHEPDPQTVPREIPCVT